MSLQPPQTPARHVARPPYRSFSPCEGLVDPWRDQAAHIPRRSGHRRNAPRPEHPIWPEVFLLGRDYIWIPDSYKGLYIHISNGSFCNIPNETGEVFNLLEIYKINSVFRRQKNALIFWIQMREMYGVPWMNWLWEESCLRSRLMVQGT